MVRIRTAAQPASTNTGGLGKPAPVIKVVAILCFMWLSSAAAIVYFYNLDRIGPFPYEHPKDKLIAIMLAALATTVIASWAPWFALRSTSISWGLLRAGGFAQLSITAFALVGWRIPTTPFTPSMLFAEYNWLTFIFEVAPAVSVATCLLVFLTWRSN